MPTGPPSGALPPPEQRRWNRMPGRPRPHELEEASRAGWVRLAPDNWSTEERARDYGIDLDVEIFRAQEATGLRFGVQVKGTDQVAVPPRVRLRASTWRYWLAQDVPVLLFVWHAKSQTSASRDKITVEIHVPATW